MKNEKTQNVPLNLCDTCRFSFATCRPRKVVFKSATEDAVIECDKFEEPPTKHGFKYTGPGRIPDTLLLNVSHREYHRRVFEKCVPEYLTYKLRKLKDVIEHSVKDGLLVLSPNENLQLLHRLKALKTVQAELDYIYSTGKTS